MSDLCPRTEPSRDEIDAVAETRRPTSELPGTGEVDVWWLTIEPLEIPAPTQLAVLSPTERAYAAAHRSPSHRGRYVRVRAALRSIAAGYLGADPALIEIACREGGKPELRTAAADLRFSVSHTETAAVLVFATGRDVGVDVESTRPDLDVAAVAATHFHIDEAPALLAVHGLDRADAFLRSWVRKEALLKCLGTGLGLGLADARWYAATGPGARLTSFAAASAPPPAGGVVRDLHVIDLDAPRAHRAALAVRGAQPPAAVVVRRPFSRDGVTLPDGRVRDGSAPTPTGRRSPRAARAG